MSTNPYSINFEEIYENKVAGKTSYFALMYGATPVVLGTSNHSKFPSGDVLWINDVPTKKKPLSRGDQYKETSVTTVRVPKKGQGKCVKCFGIMDISTDAINEDESTLEYVADPYLKATEDKIVMGYWCPNCYSKRKKEIPAPPQTDSGPWPVKSFIVSENNDQLWFNSNNTWHTSYNAKPF